MSKVIMIGCDLHDNSMRLRVSAGRGRSIGISFDTADAPAMIRWVKDFASKQDSSRIVFAYEASGQGFGLCDVLRNAGVECYVLAPTHLPHTVHSRKNKTDDKDAEMLLEQVRGHVLAGQKLHTVWVPDPQTRDDREIVRMRLELGEARTRIKNQIRSQAKRCKLTLPIWFSASGNWSKRSVEWLRDVAAGGVEGAAAGVRVALSSLVDLYEEYTRQLKSLDRAITKLAASARYAMAFRKLKLLHGVGSLTAMVFLTEMGNLARFANRRQLAAYLGLAPSAYGSGNTNDRKGHITRQGPARVRHVLCQAAWAALRVSPDWRAIYDRIRRDTGKRSKIAIVAIMRRLAISMWHTACSQRLDTLLNEIDQCRTSARARQKGSAPPIFAIASAGVG